MREHMGLYRGKRVDNGEWVTGYYCRAEHHWHNRGIHKDWIIESASANGGWFALHNKYPVISDTVGECTGLRGKNGKLIFEGDIVNIHTPNGFDMTGVVAYYDCGFEVCDEEDGAYECLWYQPSVISILGNIYDNPELLKGGEGV